MLEKSLSVGNIEQYISFINSIPLLTAQEEYELSCDWFDHKNIDAARYLVLTHLRLVVSTARCYMGYGLPFPDLIQEGSVGLMKAVDRFDPYKGVRLVTFAIHWIKAEINEYVIKNWRIVKTVTTKNQRKLFFKLRSSKNDSTLTKEQAVNIAESLNVKSEDVYDMDMCFSGADISLVSCDDGGYSPEDFLSADCDTPDVIVSNKIMSKLRSVQLESALNELDDRSQDIIKSRWLSDKKAILSILAKKYNISVERVRQIEVIALRKMRAFFV